MTDTIKISRELAEQICVELEHDNDRYMLGRELRKALATPPADAADMGGQAGEEVEVVGYAGKYQLELKHLYPQYPGMKIKKEPDARYTEALMTVAQYQRITAAMAAEVETWRSNAVMLEQANAGLAQLNGKLRTELAGVKGREAVGEVQLKTGGGISLLHVDLTQPLPPGTKLYTSPPASPDVEGLVEALQRLLSWSDRQVCTHEETHRGGAIWEICDMCGAKWADDEGGKPEFKWPDEIEGARTALSTWRQAQENKP